MPGAPEKKPQSPSLPSSLPLHYVMAPNILIAKGLQLLEHAFFPTEKWLREVADMNNLAGALDCAPPSDILVGNGGQ